ncbi:MAG: hypothetical protein LBR38_04670 [Synergistaceae bacterium]|nr:hypothetical protein [Synergistaceae bacterium]
MILGVDPGRAKVGWALVREDINGFDPAALILSGVVPSAEADAFASVWSSPAEEWEERLSSVGKVYERRSPVPERGSLTLVVLGGGTGSAEMRPRFRLPVVTVDERGTTLLAGKLYWRLHEPALWQRLLLPRFMWLPPREVDDLAAWAIAVSGAAKSKK